jgi:hypothetical protein
MNFLGEAQRLSKNGGKSGRNLKTCLVATVYSMTSTGLVSVEIQSPEEGHPLVIDLPFCSVCSASIVIPSIFSVLLAIGAAFLPPAIDHVYQLEKLPNMSYITVSSDLDDLNPQYQAFSLSIEFSQPLTFPLPISLVLSLYTNRHGKPSRELDTILPNLTIGATTANLFKGALVNYTFVRATVSMLYPAPSLTLIWERGATIGFDFVMTVKLIGALLLIPITFSISQKISKEGIVRFSFQQKLTVLLIVIVFLSHLGSVLFGLFGGSALKLHCTEILEDIVVSYIGFYSLSLFVPFLRSDVHGHVVYVGPYFMLVFSGTYLICRDVREISKEVYRFAPEQSLRPDLSLWSLGLLSFYGLVFLVVVLAGSVEVVESRQTRFRHYIVENVVMIGCAVCYVILGGVGGALQSTALFDVLPPIGSLVYAVVMFHGHQDTEKRPGFTPGKAPKITGEAIGADPIEV